MSMMSLKVSLTFVTQRKIGQKKSHEGPTNKWTPFSYEGTILASKNLFKCGCHVSLGESKVAWESQEVIFAYLSASKGSQRYHCSFESAENGWTHPVILTSHLSHLINETYIHVIGKTLPTLSSLVGSFRSWNPRIPPSCRDFCYTARALWLTYLFSVFQSHYQGRKVGNSQTP